MQNEATQTPTDHRLPEADRVEMERQEENKRRSTDQLVDTRFWTALHESGIKKLTELVEYTLEDLMMIPGIGAAGAEQIQNAMKYAGCELDPRQGRSFPWFEKGNYGDRVVISAHLCHVLELNGIYAFMELTEWSERDLLVKCPHIGPGTLQEIKAMLRIYDLGLKGTVIKYDRNGEEL